jgi:hypothetical protein
MSELMIYSTQPPVDEGKKTISVKFNNPVRKYWVQIEPASWTDIDTVPEQFRSIVDIALDNAAKNIFANYLKAYSTVPSTMPGHILAESEILDAASNDSASWLSKEELEQAWKASATRKRIIDTDKYTKSAEYRKVANMYSELVLKLSGNKISIEPEKLDWIIAKMESDDLNSEFGIFVIKRIRKLKMKPPVEKVDNLDII